MITRYFSTKRKAQTLNLKGYIKKGPMKVQSENPLFSWLHFHLNFFCEHLKLCVSYSSSAKHHLPCERRCLRPHLGLGFPSAMSPQLAGKLVSHPRKKPNDTGSFPQVFSKLSGDATGRGQGGTPHKVWGCTTERTLTEGMPDLSLCQYSI